MSLENKENEQSNTLYVKNLDEKIGLPLLKESLEAVFSPFGKILDIIAHRNIRMRGQAFVVFADHRSAQNALEEVNGFSLYDKPMEIQFAKSKSDATVKQIGDEKEIEEHKQKRLKRKEEITKEFESKTSPKEKKKETLSRKEKKARMAQEELPPNSVLFIQQLPSSVTADILTEAFEEFDGFLDVRIVPGKKGLAFVEFDTEEEAILAKEATKDLEIQGEPIKVTYAKK